MSQILDDFILKVQIDRARVIEERLRLVVQPKPRWLPQRIWERVLSRLLVIEHRSDL